MFNKTDAGNSQRFVEKHYETVKYVREWKSWALYDGKRWMKVNKGKVVELAMSMVRSMHAEASEIADTRERAEFAAWALQSESGYHINQMVDLSEGPLTVSAEEFDTDGWLLNLEDGTVDLRTGKLADHSPYDMLTKMAPVALNSKASGDTLWQKTLHEVFNDDEELIDYFQHVVGYCLTGDVSEKAMFFAYGSGDNGKSMLFGVLQDILGDYSRYIPPALVSKVPGQNKKPYDQATIVGVRLAIVAELSSGKALDEEFIKPLTGGDNMVAEAKFEMPMNFIPQAKLVIYTNYLPKVEDFTEKNWSRIKVIPFTASFIDCSKLDSVPDGTLCQNKHLKQDLSKERAGILRWMVEGVQKWRRHGLIEPQSVLDATQAFKDENDELKDFIDTRCYISTKAKMSAGKAYEQYKEWVGNDGDPMTATEFGRKLTAKNGISKKKSDGRMVYRGIGLNSDKIKDDTNRMLASVPNIYPDNDDDED